MAPRAARLAQLFFRKSSSGNLQLDSLDGLRGVAVLFVVLSHLGNEGLHLVPGVDFFGAGKYGVFLFFVLSAFLLTLLLIDRPRGGFAAPRYWLGFALRRVLRIYPLYTVVLLTGWVLLWKVGFPHVPWLTLRHVADHLLLRAGVSIYWSIPVEFTYYLVLPFVAAVFVVVFDREPRRCLAFVAAAIVAARLLWPPGASEMNTIALGPYLPIFLLGSGAALVHFEVQRRGGVPSRRMRWLLEAGALASFAAVVALVPGIHAELTGQRIAFSSFHRDFLAFGLLWSAFLLCMLNGAGPWRRALSWRPLRFVGIVSFSVYLWYLPLIHLAKPHVGAGAPAAAAVLVLVLAVAGASYLAIERPFTQSARIRRWARG